MIFPLFQIDCRAFEMETEVPCRDTDPSPGGESQLAFTVQFGEEEGGDEEERRTKDIFNSSLVMGGGQRIS